MRIIDRNTVIYAMSPNNPPAARAASGDTVIFETADCFDGQTVPAYAAAKGAVTQLTKALSNDWAGRGINVNAIAPGYMATDMNTALINDPVRNPQISARIPAGRWGTPDDMKGCTVFLASHASDYLCGAVIPVDGGYLVK